MATEFYRITSRENVRVPPNFLIIFALIAILTVVGATLNDRFATVHNFLNVFEQSAMLGLVSLGQTLAMLTGGIDISIGSAVSLLSSLTSGLIDGHPERIVPVCLGIICLGGLIGLCNGLSIVALRVHPLIATLGMSAILQGAVLLYTLTPAGSVPREFTLLAYGRIYGVPIGAALVVMVAILVAVFLRRTVYGRYIYAVGDDSTAAKMIGLPWRQVILLVYTASGVGAALAAIYAVSRFGVGQPYTGATFTLASITPVVIGGTVLTGGRGGVIGTLLGCYLLSLLNNLLNFLNISTYIQLVVQGVIIIVAVSIYVEKNRRAA